jgi:two-component system invasion response regulator UvrY
MAGANPSFYALALITLLVADRQRDKAMAGGDDRRVTVLLVDDHAVVREGYRQLLERRRDMVVIGEAGDAAEAHRLFCKLVPQIVVMDIALPGVSGIEATRRMLAYRPDTRVLILSMHEDAIFARRALQAGAFGYVTKTSAPDILVEAARDVASGRKYLSADVVRALALDDSTIVRAASDALSPSEFEVLRLLVQGQSISEIAHAMDLDSKTIYRHQSVIRQKLRVDSAIELFAIANDFGLASKH